MAQERLILTESQLTALEKAKADKEAHGEFDTARPGYCGAQDTFYVGNLKGVGRVYARGDRVRSPAALAALHQIPDVMATKDTSAMIDGIGLHADPPTADIGNPAFIIRRFNHFEP